MENREIGILVYVVKPGKRDFWDPEGSASLSDSIDWIKNMKNSFINNEADYKKYLSEIEKLMNKDPAPATEDGERLLLLALAIKEYEDKKFFFNKPSAIEAIKFRMEEKRLKQKDLVPYIGSKSKVSEILAGKRKLTLSMIRVLHNFLDIPVQFLIGESKEGDIKLISQDVNWPTSKFYKIMKEKICNRVVQKPKEG